MNFSGERVLVFGDSLTQHSDAGPIWEVDRDSRRVSWAPGDLLASLLFEKGATVRTNARVSRSAVNFWTREAGRALVESDLAWRPTKVVFVLGTNDVGLAAGPDEIAFTRLRDAYAQSGAEIWAIGPFQSRLPSDGVSVVTQVMQRVFGPRFIDGRSISVGIRPGKDGVHYAPHEARLLALSMVSALALAPGESARGPGRSLNLGLGLAFALSLLVGGAVAYKLRDA